MTTHNPQHDAPMRLAIEQALRARDEGEVPVGAVVWQAGRVIGAGYNRREQDQDPTAHAEMVALRRASAHLESWRLTDAIVYVTLEPCPMCAGALINGRVKTVVYGCRDPKAGAMGTLYQLQSDSRLNHQVELVEGVLSEECSALLSAFFADIRARVRQGRGKPA